VFQMITIGIALRRVERKHLAPVHQSRRLPHTALRNVAEERSARLGRILRAVGATRIKASAIELLEAPLTRRRLLEREPTRKVSGKRQIEPLRFVGDGEVDGRQCRGMDLDEIDAARFQHSNGASRILGSFDMPGDTRPSTTSTISMFAMNDVWASALGSNVSRNATMTRHCNVA